jgi:predicted nuclease with TOPRIM domain
MTFEVKRVAYEACFNLGNYENEKIRVEATWDGSEPLEEVVDHLRKKCSAAAQPDAQKTWDERYKLQSEVRKLEKRLQELQQNWDTVSTFLKTQGIKPDVAEFPMLSNLLPAAPASEVVDGELDDHPF